MNAKDIYPQTRLKLIRILRGAKKKLPLEGYICHSLGKVYGELLSSQSAEHQLCREFIQSKLTQSTLKGTVAQMGFYSWNISHTHWREYQLRWIDHLIQELKA